MKKITPLIIASLIILSSCFEQKEKAEIISTAPAGEYFLDKTHASLIFRINHLGLSNYTARFKKFDSTLKFDPKNPEKSKVVASIDPLSLETDFPNPKPNFNLELQGDKFLDIAKFPKITFTSTTVKLTGANTAMLSGDLELHGIKKPITLNVTFNGGYDAIPMDPEQLSRIGFSARGSLKRSDFGIAYGIPAPNSKMGVGDEVEIIIEAEFNKNR